MIRVLNLKLIVSGLLLLGVLPAQASEICGQVGGTLQALTLKTRTGKEYPLYIKDTPLSTLAKLASPGRRICVPGQIRKNEAGVKTIVTDDIYPFVIKREIADCTVVKMFDDGVFEEGLSVEEYPDVAVDLIVASDDPSSPRGLVVSVGMVGNYTQGNGDKVMARDNGSKTIVQAQYKDDESVLTVSVNKNIDPKTQRRWGRILYRTAGARDSELALLLCK